MIEFEATKVHYFSKSQVKIRFSSPNAGVAGQPSAFLLRIGNAVIMDKNAHTTNEKPTSSDRVSHQIFLPLPT